MNYTIVIVIVTCLISILGFTNEELQNKLILWPRRMNNPAQYYRLLTSGFIHADWMHLAFNMIALYSFGSNLAYILGVVGLPAELCIIIYLSAIIIASLPSYLKHRNDSFYRSLGASGGVAAVMFFSIYFVPWGGIGFIGFPFKIPSIIFGALYLAFELYASRRGVGNVNHDAHFWGAVYGLFVAFLLDPTHGRSFVDAITHPVF
jgi:membrane associated rhomboid family serine protease